MAKRTTSKKVVKKGTTKRTTKESTPIIEQQANDQTDTLEGNETQEVVEEQEVTEEEVDNIVETDVSEESSEINPEEIIGEFRKATEEIDSIMTPSKTIDEIKVELNAELKRAEEVEEQLKNKIEEDSKKINKQVLDNFTKIYNGSVDGWFN